MEGKRERERERGDKRGKKIQRERADRSTFAHERLENIPQANQPTTFCEVLFHLRSFVQPFAQVAFLKSVN